MSKVNRILFVVQNAEPFQSGRARQACKIADRLENQGIKVDILSLDYESTEVKNTRINYRKSIYDARSNYAFLLLICLRYRYKAVHFHGFNYLVGMTNLLKPLGIRCILNMSCKSFDTPSMLTTFEWLGDWQRKALNRVDHWIVQNPSDLDDRYSTYYLPNIVEMPSKMIPWEERSLNIINIGVVCPRKNQLALIKSFQAKPAFRERGFKLIFCGSFAGNYEEYDKDYVDACLALAKNDSSIEFLGHLDQGELHKVMSNARYFTAMSEREGLSNAYLECLANGLRPIIDAEQYDDLFPTLELVEEAIHWQANKLVDERIFNTDWPYKSISEKVRDHFSEDVIMPKLLALYHLNKDSEKATLEFGRHLKQAK